MKTEIKKLKALQKIMLDNQYPGYPYQKSLVIDVEEQVAYVDFYEKVSLDKALKDFAMQVAYMVIGCNKMTKGTWIITQDMSDLDTLRNTDYNDYYIDDDVVAKMYCMLNCAVITATKLKQKKKFIFSFCDLDSEWTDTRVFDTEQEIDDYINEYWSEE